MDRNKSPTESVKCNFCRHEQHIEVTNIISKIPTLTRPICLRIDIGFSNDLEKVYFLFQGGARVGKLHEDCGLFTDRKSVV